MAKLTQAQVKESADAIIALDAKIAKVEDARGKELAPFLQKLEEDTKAINEKYDRKVEKLRTERTQLLAEVIAWLQGHGKVIALEGETAVAANELVVGKRVIHPATFFERVKERTTGFWDCVTIGIAKAEKLIGKNAVDEIASKETSLVATVKAK